MTMQTPHEPVAPDMLAKLYLIGSGISFPEHLTFQTLEILKRCKHIFTNLPPKELEKIPNALRDRVTGLWEMYKENRSRSDNYQDVIDRVFESISRESPIGWLTPGHPMIFDSVSQALLKLCAANNVTVSIVPAISSLDTIIAQLGVDPADGLFIYEATAAFEQNVYLNNQFATCLLQPSAFGSSLSHYTDAWTPDLRPLSEYLMNFYPPDHRCALVRSFSQAGSSSVCWRTLANLHQINFDQLAGSTLFIPPRIV
jgi:uncharacterized protein YabN with tetrapyrrole methylase and pyrophosphatase domain